MIMHKTVGFMRDRTTIRELFALQRKELRRDVVFGSSINQATSETLFSFSVAPNIRSRCTAIESIGYGMPFLSLRRVLQV